ncbi:ParB/RepB/Spo0J family partition protein [Sodalis ligni]|uniref:ParB family chromosome partitioning protein n=1 Tax=Sodalis ligni TaxID=2697027 RepID=A0A4R1NLM4_9GAMM|nr:ParB/RepB/Spo0J family partition protein [Sodalis ligni]TCL06871.1 ParB family chromosome partitioning protein [Sodalis ligni]
MAKNSVDVYGASGKTNVLKFAPEALHLVDDPTHPLYDERIHLPLDEAMVLNIMNQGVIEPIVVWKDKETGQVCVVDGRQRVKHAKEANVRLQRAGESPLFVPGVVRDGSARRMQEAMVSANEIRRPDTPLGRAKKMADMLSRGNDEADLALFFGIGIQTVQATISLLHCTQAVQDAVESGQITVGHARQLAELPPEVQREKAQELVSVAQETKGHEKARRQRAVLGEVRPRIKSRKEITTALALATGEYAAALQWVLGEGDAA